VRADQAEVIGRAVVEGGHWRDREAADGPLVASHRGQGTDAADLEAVGRTGDHTCGDSDAGHGAIDDAKFEAKASRHRRIGSEHLLLALLHEEALAQLVGVDASAARDAADELDRSALAAIELDLGEFPPTGRTAIGGDAPLSPGATAGHIAVRTRRSDRLPDRRLSGELPVSRTRHLHRTRRLDRVAE
jgi:hypothetical protein